jgi:hypothetical protein
LAQNRASRSKQGKVIYRQIDMFAPTRSLRALDDDPTIRPYIENR